MCVCVRDWKKLRLKCVICFRCLYQKRNGTKEEEKKFHNRFSVQKCIKKKCGECTYVNIGRLDLDNYRHERQVVPNDNHTCMMQIRTKNLISIYRCNLHIFKVMFTLCVFSIAMDQPLTHSLAPHSLAMYIIHKLE